MVKELGKGQTDFIQPRPVQIAKHDALFGFLLRAFDQTHLA